jgi:TolB-like protein
MTLLWGDRGEEQARASLRQELATLRKALPEGTLLADRSDIWLEETAVAPSDGAELLAGFDLPGEVFADWLRQARSGDIPVTALPRGRPSLAILPFVELGAPEADMFADGIVEEITGALSRVHDFHVTARQSAYAVRGEALDSAEIAARLGVAYLVEGSVRRSGERVRIAVQLVQGSDGHVLWSEKFDDRIDDLFDLQDRIAARVAGQISPNLRMAEISRARSTPPADRSAYELVLSAMPHFWAHRREDNRRAIRYLDEALVRDPDFGWALAMKSWCHAQEAAYLWSGDPATDRRIATDCAERAAPLAGDHAPTLTAICAGLSLTTEDQSRPKTFIDRALAIDPNSAWGWLRSGWLHCLFNRPDAALEHFARSEALSPLDPFLFNIRFGQANASAELGRIDDAIDLVREGLNMAPGVEWAYRMLAAYHGMKGDEAGAAAALKRYLAAYPGITIAKMRAGMPPSIYLTQKAYFEGMRRAGVPEE